MHHPKFTLLAFFITSTASLSVNAIRPLVTDDARVVGDGLAQIESWLDGNDHGISHNLLAAFGPTDWLELTTGFVHGGSFQRNDGGYGIAGPLFQFKALAREAEIDGLPGVALAGGVVPAFGGGFVKPEGTSAFGFAALTESLFNDTLLLHGNLGTASYQYDDRWSWTLLGGTGLQQKLIGDLHGVAEIYYGDPYAPFATRWETQVGFRYLLSESVQFDGTIGKTLRDDSDRWWTLGIRLVSPSLW